MNFGGERSKNRIIANFLLLQIPLPVDSENIFFQKIYSDDIKYFIENYHIWCKSSITFVVDIAFGLDFLLYF